MTKSEAIALAESAGLHLPRIIPHKGKGGSTVWHLCYGVPGEREAIVVPVNVSDKALKKAIEDAQAS